MSESGNLNNSQNPENSSSQPGGNMPPFPSQRPAGAPATPSEADESTGPVFPPAGAEQNAQSPGQLPYATAPLDGASALGPSDQTGSAQHGHDAPEQQHKKSFGLPAVLTIALLAGLLGGGIGAGALYGFSALNDDSSGVFSAEDRSGDRSGNTGGVNREENTTLVTDAAATASPSVVTISASSSSGSGSGSGVILDDQGHILTNTHVVTLGGATGDAELSVQTADSRVYTAEVVGTDPLSDLAVIKIDAEGLTPIEMGSSSDLNVGDQTIAIGAPLGLSGTVTDGIVSQMDRTIAVQSSAAPEPDSGPGSGGDDDGLFEFHFPGQQEQSQSSGVIHINVIQSDAAINPGNSGGALVDSQGRLIGINVAIASAGGSSGGEQGNIGLGFAIPVDYAQRVAGELIENGEATHGALGVSVTPEAARTDGSESAGPLAPGSGGGGAFAAGARVVDVADGSPADEAGIQEGDVITSADGKPTADSQALTATVREHAAGSEITLGVTRDGEQQEVQVTLGDESQLGN
ncbi:S1C family serine protease [Auritidibacter sp. NML100628]|uniref:S1C family serine protease n=1 Tax=Auritidibacter sp. NML100628 TaxID=2170742 RepID=UPI000D73F39C|nr:trypsin-like peptidase domain-containing protein [Auritidibacter sp. NML100628]PXA77435.1 protease Do [Auritidibacter sp. NML100628]